MSYTNEIEVTGNWQALGPAGRNVMIQLQGGGPARVAVATTTPVSDYGMDLSKDGLREVSIEGVEVGDIVYAKAFGAGSDSRAFRATLALLISGVAP